MVGIHLDNRELLKASDVRNEVCGLKPWKVLLGLTFHRVEVMKPYLRPLNERGHK
jgi:hypothetical protein